MIKDMTVGGITGGVAKTISAPLERVKLLLQTQDSNKQLLNKRYKGFLDCLIRIPKEEGFLAYWKGNGVNVIRYFPTTALNFGFKDYFNRLFAKNERFKEQKLAKNVMAGGLAGCCCMIFVYPLEFARTRLGVDVGKEGQKQYKNMRHCIYDTVTKNGIKGIYQGLGISMASIFSYRGMYFGFYDYGKHKIEDYENISIWKKLCFAQAVTMSSETINYPFDTIRRRMMMNAGLKQKMYENTVDCYKKIMEKEGINGFFKGCFSNMVRSLGSSIVLVIYDEIHKMINQKKK